VAKVVLEFDISIDEFEGKQMPIGFSSAFCGAVVDDEDEDIGISSIVQIQYSFTFSLIIDFKLIDKYFRFSSNSPKYLLTKY
jgi:hypothetical protein